MNSDKGVQRITQHEKPEEPAQSDCCGSGCTPCVFDIYEQELKIWERECQRRLKSDSDDASQQKLDPDQYTSYEIQSLEREAEDCIRFRFQLPDGTSLGLSVGQHVIIRGWSGLKSVIRQYTPVSPLNAIGYFDIVIKIYPTGKMSQITNKWRVGDSVEFRGPFGNISYKRNKFRKMICLAAGTGIAPMIQVIRSVLDDEEDETRIDLLYSVKRYSQIIMKPCLDEWAGFWNFSCTFFLSEEKEEENINHCYGDKIIFSSINKDIIESKLNTHIDKTLVMICGTVTYDKDVLNIIKEMGVPDCNIHKF